MEVSGFTMHLYCDYPRHGEIAPFKGDSVDGEYTHPSKRWPTIQDARKDGWIFKRNGDTICPLCAKESKK